MRIHTIGCSWFLAPVASSVIAQEAPKCPLGDGWKFVPEFSAEFDGAALDGSKWWDFNPYRLRAHLAEMRGLSGDFVGSAKRTVGQASELSRSRCRWFAKARFGRMPSAT